VLLLFTHVWPNVVTDRLWVMPLDHALRRWSLNYLQSMQGYKDPRAGLQLQNLMTQAGFVQVEVQPLTLPLSGWSNGSLSYPRYPTEDMSEPVTDPRDRDIGAANRENVHRLLSSLAVYPFTEGLGYVCTGVPCPGGTYSSLCCGCDRD
jgi:hypothetical protein